MAKQTTKSILDDIIKNSKNPLAVAQAQEAMDSLKSDMARSMKENLSAINASSVITKKGVDSQKETLQLTKSVAADIKRMKKGQDELIKIAGKTNGLLGTILKTNQSYYETNNELIQNLLAENGLNATRSQELFKQMANHSKTGGEKVQAGPSLTPASTSPSSSMSLADLIEDALGLVAAGKAAKSRVSGNAETKPPKPESKVADADTKPPKPESKVADADTKPPRVESKVADADTKPPRVESKVADADTKPTGKVEGGNRSESKPTAKTPSGNDRVEPKLSTEPERRVEAKDDFRPKPSERIGADSGAPESYEDLSDRVRRANNAKKSLGMPERGRVEPTVEPLEPPKITPPEVKPAEVKSSDFRADPSERINGRPSIGESAVPKNAKGSNRTINRSKVGRGLGRLLMLYGAYQEVTQGKEEYAAAEQDLLEGKIKQDEANKRKAEAVTGTAGSITGMVAGAEAGALVGGTIGAFGGPAAPLTVPAGMVIGGYFGAGYGSEYGREGGKRLVELAGVQTEDEKKKNLEEYEREKKKIAQDNAKQAGVKYEENRVKKRPADSIAAQAWDYKYGQQYNPDGSMKNLEPAQKTPMSHVERLEQGGTNSAPITIINQGDTINNNSSGRGGNAGSTPVGAPGVASPSAPRNPWDLRLYGYPASD